jgi:SAM-dependent methyltransferase
MTINYNHSLNLHTLEGPRTALPALFPDQKPYSLLDVGCGNGTWLKTALEFGIPEVFGVDGVEVTSEELHVDRDLIKIQDLRKPWDLNKKFDVVICLEVAEHLDSNHAETLIASLVKHGTTIYFSAACPGQPGQHHVNCQWPEYWQNLFNEYGYVCEDTLRWKIWDDFRIEPWYRQNLFVAKISLGNAGKEPRIPSVVHPEIWENIINIPPPPTLEDHVDLIERGRMNAMWYTKAPIKGLWAKMKRQWSKS